MASKKAARSEKPRAYHTCLNCGTILLDNSKTDRCQDCLSQSAGFCWVCGDPVTAGECGSTVCQHPDCIQCEKILSVSLSGDKTRLKAMLLAAGTVVRQMVYFACDRRFPLKSYGSNTKEKQTCFLIKSCIVYVCGRDWLEKDPDFLITGDDIAGYRKDHPPAPADLASPPVTASTPATFPAPDAPVAPGRLVADRWVGALNNRWHYARNLVKLFKAGRKEAWLVDVAGKQSTIFLATGEDLVKINTYPTKAAAEKERARLHAENIPDLDNLHRLNPRPHMVRSREYNTPMEIWHDGNGVNLSRLCKLDKSTEENIRTVRELMDDPDIFEDSISKLDDVLEKLIAIRSGDGGIECTVCGRRNCNHRFCKMVCDILNCIDKDKAKLAIDTTSCVEVIDIAHWMEYNGDLTGNDLLLAENRPRKWLLKMLDERGGILSAETGVQRILEDDAGPDDVAEMLETHGPDWPAIEGTESASGEADPPPPEETGLITLPRAPVKRVNAELCDDEPSAGPQPDLPGMPPPDKSRFLYILHDPQSDGHGSVREIMAFNMVQAAKEICLNILDQLNEVDAVDGAQQIMQAMSVEDCLDGLSPWSTFIVHIHARAVVVSLSMVDGFSGKIYKKALVHGSLRMLKLATWPVTGR